MSLSSGSWRSKDGGQDARLGDENGNEGVAGGGAVEVGGVQAYGSEPTVGLEHSNKSL